MSATPIASREAALRIALAARTLNGLDVRALVGALDAKLEAPLTETKLGTLTVDDLRVILAGDFAEQGCHVGVDAETLKEAIRAKGVGIAEVTLHVGLGTFRPVMEDEIADHKMHSEWYSVSEETAQRIRETKAAGHRVIAVGTTSCRTLEAVAAKYGEIKACSGNTSIFLYPGVKFNCIDGLITNFHLPESTLIMLVSALYGYEKTMAAYKVAVEQKYRFFSFGDAMLIL